MFPPVVTLILGVPYSIIFLILSLLQIIPIWIGQMHFIFSLIICFIYITILKKNANNTFCCITNKRIIRRNGAFSNNFINYSLKNNKEARIEGSTFDDKGENLSATHTGAQGTTRFDLAVDSFKNAYDGYKIIKELTAGNNENLRVKVEK